MHKKSINEFRHHLEPGLVEFKTDHAESPRDNILLLSDPSNNASCNYIPHRVKLKMEGGNLELFEVDSRRGDRDSNNKIIKRALR